MAQVFILTGASKGIGAAIAEYILSANTTTKLVAVARSSTQLDALIEKYGSDRVIAIVGDVSDESTSQRAVLGAVEKWGRVDSIIANAGVLDPVGPVSKSDVTSWKKLFDINLFAVVDLIAKSLPELRKSHGRIIAVSSGASTKSYDGWSAYGASKAALNHLIQSVAEEEKGVVSAISIAPGVVDTDMQVDIRQKFGANMKPEALKRFTDLHSKGELLPASVPAAVYGKLALNGWDSELNGKYWRYNDEVFK
ncbi:benzil reductase ((S)-benzoin forming) Irc24p [[Candida] anglica]|uniref:Benzil reductase ((S)-benzoin forming) Irc24p n=1 Tax=[Candida] anglica TaxID=148631 RepID=A0ABP0ED73_9ASCO